MTRTLIVIRIEYFVFAQPYFCFVQNPNEVEIVSELIKDISHLAYITKTESDFITLADWDEFKYTKIVDFINECNTLENA